MEFADHKAEIKMKGLPLSAGCAVARVCLFNEGRHGNLPRYRVAGEGLDTEIHRYEKALSVVERRLETIRQRVQAKVGKAEAAIFVAQRMLAGDRHLHDDIVQLIRQEQVNAEAAVIQVLDQLEARLTTVDDEYMRDRASDFGEVKRRILDVLADTCPSLECEPGEHCQAGRNRIIVAEELTPSLIVDLDIKHLMGFATEHGGFNSHAAILARALGIPAVSGLHEIRQQVHCGTEMLLDGNTGQMVIWPTEKTVAAAHAADPGKMRMPRPVAVVPGFEVLANAANETDVQQALAMKAEGIGLYRTEIELIATCRLPEEAALAARYTHVVKAMAGRKVVFRLFDLGSDKPLPNAKAPREANPSLGRRGARLLLARQDLLAMQARALARASRHGPIQILYPMIDGVAQFVKLRKLVTAAMAGMDAGEISHGPMLEVPAACLEAAALFAEADFASVGSNDLTQYLFAVDRDNELVAEDYNPDQPAFWHLLEAIVAAASQHGKPIAICGELAGDPRFIPRLFKLGIRSVSISPRRISCIRHAVRKHLGKFASPG